MERMSSCCVKWDVEMERTKHIFRDQTNENSKEPKEKTLINDLSDELVLNIMKYLPPKTLCLISRVSKRWNRIAFDSSLWKCIDLSKKYLSLSQLQSLLKNGVICLRLSSTTITDTIAYWHSFDTISSFNFIQYLDLSLAQISVQSINCLLDSNFIDISLKKLSLESLTIDQKTLDLIVVKHKELEVLNISMIQLSDNQMISLSDKLPETLTQLNISWITRLDINQIITFLPKSLKRLNISGFREGLQDLQMAVLVTICPDLIELDLCDSVLLTNQSLRCIETHLTRLEVLHISRCLRITDLSPLMFMKNLKMVSIQGISLNQSIDLQNIQINERFISTIARPNLKLINDSYSSVWEIALKIV